MTTVMRKRFYPNGESPRWLKPKHWYFKRTGAYRFPLKGEWYLSGATPEAYQAKDDMTDMHAICEPIPNPPTIVVWGGFKYRLEGPDG